ncbi:ComEC/Rec2 family competence protein [Candidatus Dependentiae bacterium]|nr:ComEC/Rec2 family competence protein [Candidatus Dependentiae bacterium]
MIFRKFYQLDSLYFSIVIILSAISSIILCLNAKLEIYVNSTVLVFIVLIYYSLSKKKYLLIFILSIFIFFYIQTSLLNSIRKTYSIISNKYILLSDNMIKGRVSDFKIIDMETAVFIIDDLIINNKSFGDMSLSATVTGIENYNNLLDAEYISFKSKIKLYKISGFEKILPAVFKKNAGWTEIEADKINFIKKTQNIIFKTKFFIYSRFYNIIPYPFNNIAYSIISGNIEVIDEAVISSFQKSGIIHILAISGLHIGLISMMLIAALKFFFNYDTVYFISILLLWFYCSFVGFTPSVFRATLMITFYLTGKIIHKNIYTPNVLLTGFITILLINPTDIFSIGFQLSFLSVAAIITSNYFFKIKNNLINILIMSLFIQVFTFPLVSYYFKIIPLFSIIINLVVIPIFTIALPLVFIIFLLSCFSMYAGKISGFAAAGLFYIIIKLSDTAYIFGIKNIIQYKFSKSEVALYYILLCVILEISDGILFSSHKKDSSKTDIEPPHISPFF